MQLTYFIIPFLSFLKHVTSKFHCVGTCYSGETFPLPEDIVFGKHLIGYSYKNISTDDPKKCYSSCINNCRCKACQMKRKRCELLDEDHTSKPNDFVAASGYVYYDLKQEFYKGKSHMVEPGVCYNGCCRSQPCMNGGTCIQHCDTPKKKFTCKCPNIHVGRVCEKKMSSCMDVMAAASTVASNGVYRITRTDTNTVVPVYCAFVSPNQAWTLIESFSFENNVYYKKGAFHQDLPRNQSTPSWTDHRISLNNMQYFRTKATMFRATCDFPNRGNVLTPDYLFGYLSDYDIINRGNVNGKCFKFAHMNVRGYDYLNVSVEVWHWKYYYHLHIGCDDKDCAGFKGVPESSSSEDAFGHYGGVLNRKQKCVASAQSTTQWWLGEQK